MTVEKGKYINNILTLENEITKLIDNWDDSLDYIEIQYIQHLKHKNDLMLELLVTINPYNIKYVNNPSYDLCLKVVKKNGMLIRNIKYNDTRMLLEAVKQNGLAINLVRWSNDTIRCAAVKSCPKAFHYISKISNKVFYRFLLNCNEDDIGFIGKYGLQNDYRINKFRIENYILINIRWGLNASNIKCRDLFKIKFILPRMTKVMTDI